MRSWWGTAAAAVATTGLGLWFALRVPLGLPYDEPAHWGTVLAYASDRRLPLLGDPGVPYEAQMGPVYYTLAAVLLGVTGGTDQPGAPTVLRVAGVALMPVLVLLTHRIGRLMAAPPAVATAASVVIATTPLVLAVGGSIQNDYLCFVLMAVCLVIGMRLLRRPDASWGAHLALGVVVGLAILTKVVALALIPALVLGYLLHRAALRTRLGWAVAAVLGVVATSGWWFVRNLLVYGDLTGANGMARMGIVFPPLRWTGLGDVAAWFGNIVSYVYIPVEYYRNVLKSPVPLRVTAVVLAALTVLVLVVQAVRAVRQRPAARSWLGDPARAYALATLVFAIIGWVAFSVAVFNGAPRLAFHAAPVAAVVFAAATQRRPYVLLAVATVAAFLVADVWLVTQAAQVTGLPTFG